MNLREKIKVIGQTILELTGIYKSEKKIISGVCKGLAERFKWNASVVRILWLLTVPFTLGGTLLIYIILMFIMPYKNNNVIDKYNKNNNDYIDVNSREL